MAYDIELKPKVTSYDDLDKLEKRIKQIGEEGVSVDVSVNDKSQFVELSDKIKELEEKGITLDIKLDKNIEADNKALLSRVKQLRNFVKELNALTGDQSTITKTIDLRVNTDDISKQILNGLKILDKLNPNDTAFAKSLNKYKTSMAEIDDALTDISGGEKKFNSLKELTEYFSELETKANTAYSAIKKLENLKKKDNTLYERLASDTEIYESEYFGEDEGGEIREKVKIAVNKMVESATKKIEELQVKIKKAEADLVKTQDTIKGREEDTASGFVKGQIKEIARLRELIDSYRAEIEKFQALQAEAQKYAESYTYTPKNIGTRSDEEERVAVVATTATKQVAKSVTQANAAIAQVNTDNATKELHELANTEEQVVAATQEMNDTPIQLPGLRGDADTLLADTKTFLASYFSGISDAFVKLSNAGVDWIKPMNASMAKVEGYMKKMKDMTSQIKSPFDEASIAETQKKFDDIFNKFNSLDGTQKEIKIGVKISEEDRELLDKAAQYAREIYDKAKLIRDYQALKSKEGQKALEELGGQKKSKKGKEDPNALNVLEQTNKALEAYDKLVPKEVKITLLIENLDDLEKAVTYFTQIDNRNKKVSGQQTKSTSSKKPKSGVFTPFANSGDNNQGKSDGANQGNGGEKDPETQNSLKLIIGGLDSIYKKIEEVNTKLSNLKIEISSDASNKQSQGASTKSPTPNSGNGQDDLSGDYVGIAKEIMSSIKFSTDTMGDMIDRIDHFLLRLTRRFPVKNGETYGIPSDTESTNKGDDSPDNNNVVLESIKANTENISSKSNDILEKLSAIQKKIPTAKSLSNNATGKENTGTGDGDANTDSLISTLIDPKLGTIQQSVTNIDTNLANGETSEKTKSADKTSSVASNDVKNINKNVTAILTAIKKLGENKKSSGSKKEDSSKTKSKDNTATVKEKLNNLPTKLNGIQQSNSNISKNTKAIQTNTGNTSTKVGQVRDTIKSGVDTVVSHLATIENNTKQTENPNAPTNSNFATLETAIQNLTTALQNPSALQNAQNTQNSNTAPNAAQVAATLSNVSNLKAQSDNRIKELQKVLGIMGNGNFSSIFGSTQDVQSYINSLETLNKEIANAGRMLNRNDISPAQRTSAENTLQTKATVLNGIINGDDSLGFDAAKINNMITLLRNMETINSRISGVDGALQGLTKLKETLNGYKITVQPLEDAINSLKSTKQELNNLTGKLADSSLDEGQFQQLTATIAANQQSYQDAIDNATKILNTEQPDSIQSITTNFITAQKEIEKYQAKVDSLKDLLQNLKNKNIDPAKLNMGNGKTAKDLQNFLNTYEQFLNQNKNLSNPQEMQAFATNFQTNYQQPLDQYVSGLRQANRELSNMTSITRQATNADSFAKKVADFTTRVQKWGNTNSTALKDKNYLREYEQILGKLTSGAAITEERLRQLKTQFAQLNLRVNQAGVATKSFTDKLKEMFKKYGGWTLVTRTLNTAMRLLRSMVTQVKEVDTAMTNLRKVTEATGRQLNDFLESAGKRSVSLGASLTDYIDAVSEFSRLGKKIDEAQRLGELATMYKTVAEDLDIKTASQSLISTMQAFSQAGVQAEEIVDKFNYVGKIIAQQCSNVLKESSYIG